MPLASVALSSPSPLSVGQRVCESGAPDRRATVRFLGEVPGSAPGLWVGVEWDDPERGRHDGSHGGRRYFSTRSGAPRCASFVRPKKVSAGMALGEAARRRYGQVEGATAGVDQEVLSGLRREINAPFLEVVGFDKVNRQQSDFARLRVVSLRASQVRGLALDEEEEGPLGAWMPQVRELNLAENLLWRWADVAEVGRELGMLTALNLACNRFCNSPDPVLLGESFANLRSLVLNDLGYDWPELVEAARGMPRLECLHVASNKISKLTELPKGVLSGLSELDLSDNQLGDWEGVLHLRRLPNLKRLIVNACGITRIHFDGIGAEEEKECFPALRMLQFSRNDIKDWVSISSLHRLSLEDVRVRSNPVLETENGETCR